MITPDKLQQLFGFHPKPVKVCLSMIIKNENNSILRCLRAANPLIHTWCIVDTGSTDGCEHKVEEFFESVGKPGQLLRRPFVNFGISRSAALRDAVKMQGVTHILLLDSDMEIKPLCEPEAFWKVIEGTTSCRITQRSGIAWTNTRVLGESCFDTVSYVGSTHEYVDFGAKGGGGGRHILLPEDLIYIHDHGDGGSKADKYPRDVRLLKAEIVENPGKPRPLFYLARTYHDMGDYKNAIKTFEEYFKVSNFPEELWYAKYCVCKCWVALREDAKALVAGHEAFLLRPTRSEPLMVLADMYDKPGSKKELAWMYLTRGSEIPFPKGDVLFIESTYYDWKFLFKKSILAFYVGRLEEGLRLSDDLLLPGSRLPEANKKMVRTNLAFYPVPTLESFTIALPSPPHNPFRELCGMEDAEGKLRLVAITEDKAAVEINLQTKTTQLLVVQDDDKEARQREEKKDGEEKEAEKQEQQELKLREAKQKWSSFTKASLEYLPNTTGCHRLHLGRESDIVSRIFKLPFNSYPDDLACVFNCQLIIVGKDGNVHVGSLPEFHEATQLPTGSTSRRE